MSTKPPSPDKISAATEAAMETKRQSVLKKEALKLAKVACREAEATWEMARKESRMAAKAAETALKELEKLHRKVEKTAARTASLKKKSDLDPAPAEPAEAVVNPS